MFVPIEEALECHHNKAELKHGKATRRYNRADTIIMEEQDSHLVIDLGDDKTSKRRSHKRTMEQENELSKSLLVNIPLLASSTCNYFAE